MANSEQGIYINAGHADPYFEHANKISKPGSIKDSTPDQVQQWIDESNLPFEVAQETKPDGKVEITGVRGTADRLKKFFSPDNLTPETDLYYPIEIIVNLEQQVRQINPGLMLEAPIDYTKDIKAGSKTFEKVKPGILGSLDRCNTQLTQAVDLLTVFADCADNLAAFDQKLQANKAQFNEKLVGTFYLGVGKLLETMQNFQSRIEHMQAMLLQLDEAWGADRAVINDDDDIRKAFSKVLLGSETAYQTWDKVKDKIAA